MSLTGKRTSKARTTLGDLEPDGLGDSRYRGSTSRPMAAGRQHSPGTMASEQDVAEPDADPGPGSYTPNGSSRWQGRPPRTIALSDDIPDDAGDSVEPKPAPRSARSSRVHPYEAPAAGDEDVEGVDGQRAEAKPSFAIGKATAAKQRARALRKQRRQLHEAPQRADELEEVAL